jgi:hypothetical protein
MQTVEIFKTNVNSRRVAGRILKALHTHLPALAFNFDLEDCDRILRVKGRDIKVEIANILHIVKAHSVEISLLEG